MFRDISERKRADERQNMLMAELDHRVKNILAVVQSMARQSLGRGGQLGPEAAGQFVGRLNALAQSHGLLASSRWDGTQFRDLFEIAVAPYRGQRPDRVVAQGPEVRVTPKAAQTLSLAMHEMVTNAAKYGALSCDGGQIAAEWHLEDAGGGSRLVFTWQERGGPPIAEAPRRRGFGGRLIEQTLAFEFRGEVALDYARDGLRAVIKLPLDRLAVPDGDPAVDHRHRGEPPSGDPACLNGKKVLVVEDEYLVALETVKTLVSAGCAVTGPVSDLLAALKVAAIEDLDAAVLDINLNGDFVRPVAHALRARKIPTIFATGYSGTI